MSVVWTLYGRCMHVVCTLYDVAVGMGMVLAGWLAGWLDGWLAGCVFQQLASGNGCALIDACWFFEFYFETRCTCRRAFGARKAAKIERRPRLVRCFRGCLKHR